MKISPILFNNYNVSQKQTKQINKNLSFADNNEKQNFSTIPLNTYKAISFGYFGAEIDIPHIFRKNKETSISNFLNLYLNLENNTKLTKQEYEKFLSSNGTLQKFAKDIQEFLRYTTYSSGGITVKEAKALLKQVKLESEKSLQSKLKKQKAQYPETIMKVLQLRREFISDLIIALSKKDPESRFLIEHEGSDFMVKVAENVYKKHDKNFQEYNKNIKKKLTYEAKTDIEKLDLASEIKKLPPGIQRKIEEDFDGDYRKMVELFVAEGCMGSRAPIEYSLEVDTALMQTLPRYKQENKDELFKIAPLSRRLSITNYDEFMKQFKVGSVYSYPKTQSCSKTMMGAEHWFQDSQRDKNVVFRIHPKAKTTKAFDIKGIDANKVTNYQNCYDDMDPRYFNSEVWYPPNAKFRVLGKTTYVKSNYSVGSPASDYIKTMIDLQEI